jgi:hypothetical protein
MDSFDAKLSRSHFGFAHFDVPARLHRREKGLNASAIRRRAFLGLDWRGKGVLQCRGGSLHRLLFSHNPLAPSSTTIILLKIPSDIPLSIALALASTV